MTITASPRLGLTQWSADSDTVNRSQFETSFANIDTEAAMFLQGTAGNRPAPGTSGRFYYATDTGLLTYDTGTAWVSVSPGSQTVTVTLPSTYAISGPVEVTSCEAGFLPPMPVPVVSGQTVSLVSVNAAVRVGNAVVAVTAGGTAVAGLGSMSVSSTLANFPVTGGPLALTNSEELAASVSSVSNSPDGLTLQFLLAYTATVS